MEIYKVRDGYKAGKFFFFFFFVLHKTTFMSTEEKKATVAIVGAGLVGSLNAIYFAQRGWKVDLFELRPGRVAQRWSL